MTPDGRPVMDEAEARGLDAADPLARFRAEFHLPAAPSGEPAIYLVGNSLGLMPRGARAEVEQVLADWERLAVDAHFQGRPPWYRYHERFREPLARLVGAAPGEVVAMNSLSVNLHLMLASFWRPAGNRTRIVMEGDAFPSDSYAIETHVRHRGLDPDREIVVLRPGPGDAVLPAEEFEAFLEAEGQTVALVLVGGVHYYSGQRHDLARITAAAHRAGALAGFDLAHAAGNVPLSLHQWGVDFAAWCSYKYLNAGPGAIAGVFVHERHGRDAALPRLAGWWGNDPETRFQMHLNPRFRPVEGADGWQLSNPPILAMAPLAASLQLFDAAGMAALREKSVRLTRCLEAEVAAAGGRRITILTPADPEARGCQLSLLVPEGSRRLFDALTAAGVVADYRPPDVIRMAPVPLYNSFHDIWRLGQALRAALDA